MIKKPKNFMKKFHGHMLLVIVTKEKLLERFTKTDCKKQIKKKLQLKKQCKEKAISSNVNKVFRAILNFFFFTKRFHTCKKHKTHIYEQIQKRQHFYVLKKHLRRKKSLIHLFAFLCFLCLL